VQYTLDDGRDFPAEIKRVLHADVHPLSCLRGMRVDSVSGKEYAVM
jgi:hypothetical protein